LKDHGPLCALPRSIYCGPLVLSGKAREIG